MAAITALATLLGVSRLQVVGFLLLVFGAVACKDNAPIEPWEIREYLRRERR